MGYYDDISEGYEELHKEEQEKKIAFIKEYFDVKVEDKLLDVGCGTGITTIPWNCDRTGLDPAPKLLEKAHDKDSVKYVLAQAENIPFSENEFSVVVSITAIQNFSDVKKGLKEIYRVGRDRFVLTFLKKSSKRAEIEQFIEEIFDVKNKLEEDKDIIYIAGKKKDN